MGRRTVHYEAAFEAYLRARGWPYILVDDAKKAVFAKVAIKSFDFVVYSDSRPNLLVDVKGRKFPDLTRASPRSARPWENWVGREDIASLRQWENVFGRGFEAMLVFAYWLQGPPQRSPFDDVFFFRNRYYAFSAISLADYTACLRPRSEKWQTVSMPAAEFTRRIRDLGSFL